MNNGRQLFQNLLKLHLAPLRTCSTGTTKPIEYFGFTYYPRRDDEKDPPYTPTKLFLIKRVKKLSGTTKEEKRILAQLNIDGDIKYRGHLNVVKNIPEINAQLWKVKHLIAVKPIRWTGELPKDGDFKGTFLRETGEFIISPNLKPTAEQLEATQKYNNDKTKLSKSYMRDYLKQKWLDSFTGTV